MLNQFSGYQLNARINMRTSLANAHHALCLECINKIDTADTPEYWFMLAEYHYRKYFANSMAAARLRDHVSARRHESIIVKIKRFFGAYHV